MEFIVQCIVIATTLLQNSDCRNSKNTTTMLKQDIVLNELSISSCIEANISCIVCPSTFEYYPLMNSSLERFFLKTLKTLCEFKNDQIWIP